MLLRKFDNTRAQGERHSSAKIMDLAAAEGDIIAAARRALGEDEFAVAWEGGQSITLEQATAEILSDDSKRGGLDFGTIRGRSLLIPGGDPQMHASLGECEGGASA